jgi:hypothetical protein
MVKITDYEGYRLRIVPTNFTKVETKFTDRPVDVIYADVTVLQVLDKDIPLGNVPIFQRMVIGQIKEAWRGRPLVGTLIKRDLPSRRRGYPPAFVLVDLEEV